MNKTSQLDKLEIFLESVTFHFLNFLRIKFDLTTTMRMKLNFEIHINK